MKESILKQRLKGLMALTLAFMLMFGSSLSVLAANPTFDLTNNLTSGTGVQTGVVIYRSGTESVPIPESVDTGSGSGHIHTLDWIVTQEPTEIQEGVAEYRCTDDRCQYVEARQPITVFGVIVEKIIKAIEEAPENGTVIIDSQFLRCFTDEIVEALLARPDVTVDVRFTEKEVDYRFVIPAGKAPADEQEWYGYFYLGGLYGWQEPVKEEENV